MALEALILHPRAHGTSMCRESFAAALAAATAAMVKWRNEEIAVLCDEALEANEPRGLRLMCLGRIEMVMAIPTPDGLVELSSFFFDEAEVTAASL